MPAPAPPPLSPAGPRAVIAIPGLSTSRPSRRSASNPAARLSAYVVRDAALPHAPPAAVTVAIKSQARLFGLSLKGHRAPVVDLEFLPTDASSRVHVLGSCDQDGIVHLWFLYIARDPLGVEKALVLLRDYSFYSLRKSTAAYYSRIRLAGAAHNGTMVLVPNDGSNVRVITFHCHPTDDPNGTPNVPVIAAPPQHAPPAALPAPPPAPPQADAGQDSSAAEDEFVDALGPVLPPPPGERPIDVARATGQDPELYHHELEDTAAAAPPAPYAQLPEQHANAGGELQPQAPSGQTDVAV